MKKLLALLILLCTPRAVADEGNLDLVLGFKAGHYQTSGNLFAEKNLQGWGLTLKLIPDDFGKPGSDEAWLGGMDWMLSLDLDHLTSRPYKGARFPLDTAEDIQLTWNVLAVYICALTQKALQLCLGLPFSNSLYLEQNVAGESFNSFTMGTRHPPVFFNLISVIKPWNFGAQVSTSYWNPTFAGMQTHFNLIQTQVFVGYVF